MFTIAAGANCGLLYTKWTVLDDSPVVKRLSVNDAVQLALEQNLDLQVQRVNPQVQDLNFASLRTFYTPNLTSSFSNGSTDSPAGRR
jgi:hypothetical protein